MYPNPQDVLPLPPRPSLEQYKKRAKELVKAANSVGPAALRDWIENWMKTLARLAEPKIAIRFIHEGSLAGQFEEFTRSRARGAKLSLAQAHFILARAHGFESWPRLAKHLAALARANSPTSAFELAADAIVSGDLPVLRRLLRENPGLVRLRSTREHQATLLIYVSANGLENYRQRTPRNIVAIAQLLLEAGADVNATANVYGGHSTTLGLVATSVHPERAGVQEALMDLLLGGGATLEQAVAPNYTSGLLVNACLANGRGHAAAYLATRGAQLDLEAAAGVGRIDVVRTFFDQAGTLKFPATELQRERALMWSSEYGRTDVVEFLLEKGASLDSRESTGLTALHWAIIGGQLDTIKLLLARGASLETRNIHGGNALGQALWAAVNDESGVDHIPAINLLLQAGARIEDWTLDWIAKQKNLSAATRARLIDVLQRHRAKS
ncbi:MAG TPA: ankyrin repeat domain-containing protein [Candidatus Sulfotelmatobacter sp.]|jgi:ankyrin repeat protein|nr:ankyrin repeat domain-containing protein [Candidatus Sulfotelmatobacter sp.]